MTTTQTLMSLYDAAVTEITKHGEVLSDKVFNAPEAEVLVRKATNSDAWGPSGTEMLKISNLSMRHTECRQIMDAIWARLTAKSDGKNWRNVYKSLLLLEYLLKNGSERIIGEVRAQIFDLKQLQKFVFVDEGDIDRGLSVRERAKQIVELVHDTERLKDERKTAAKNRSKYTESISSDGGYHSSQNYFKKKDPSFGGHHDDDDFEAPRYGGGGGGAKKKSPLFDDSDDDDFGGRAPVPKKEPWKPSFDEDPPRQKKSTTFSDDDDWGNFEIKKPAQTPAPAPAPVRTPAPVVQTPAPVQPRPVVHVAAAPAPPPVSSNPLDNLGTDLLGGGTPLLSTNVEKPLPNLFPTTGPTTGGGSALPNFFGAPAGPTTGSASFGTPNPNAFATPNPNAFATPNPNAFATPTGNIFGTPAATPNTFGTTGAVNPNAFGNPTAFGTTPGFGQPASFAPATGYPYGYPATGY